MKKTFKTMLALMAGAMTFTGCTSDILENTPEQIPSALKPMTFTATQESDATRAAIVGTAINWTEGDKISIFDGSTENNGNQEFTLTGEAGKPSGTFEGTAAEASTYYALYPDASSSKTGVPTREEAVAAAGTYEMYFGAWEAMWGNDRVVGDINAAEISQENKAIILAYFNNESITTKSGLQLNAGNIEGVAFPAAQTATVGTADPKAMLMIGTSDNTNNIQFKNVCAYLKVTPTFDCTSIVLKSNGTESLAGTVTVDYNDGNPTTTATNGTSTVTLSGTIAANSTYYIAVLPATLEGGFTVEFKDASNKVIGSKSTAKKVAFARNKVINLGSFNMYPPEGSNGSATRTGSNAEVKWVQLWENGPKFAEYNVGAASETEYGGYYCWGGIIDKDPNSACNDEGAVLTGTDDTATNLWGSKWRMPTLAEVQGLLNNCTAQWVTNYKNTDVNGMLCSGKGAYAANSIFLPAIGYSDGAKVLGQGEYGNYWTSTPYGVRAKYMTLNPNEGVSFGHVLHKWGYSVRAVLNEATTGTAKATINGSDVDVNWVQLWKDGPKFAEYNVGVTDGKAESFGSYYCWGGSIDKDSEKSYNDGTVELTGDNDTATKLWGSNWRMPTSDELSALLSECTCTTTTQNEVYGLLCTGKDDYASNSVFLPASGFHNFGMVISEGSNGFYWSSTPYESSAYYLYSSSVGQDVSNGNDRDYGQSVRAVLKESAE